MGKVPDLSAVLEGLYDKPFLGPKPDQLLIFKRPQLAIKLQALMQPATSAAAKHGNNALLNQAIAAMYQHPSLREHVVGWAPVRSGQHNSEVLLCFRDTSAQHRQDMTSAGCIQLTLPGAAEPVSLPVSTVASKQLLDVTVIRMHNVPGGINVHGLMACLMEHFQLGAGYSVVSEYGGDASGDIAAVTPTWCRSDVCIAEVRAPVHDPKLAKLPATFTCFGQQVSVSVQPSILAKAHIYQQRAQAQPDQATASPAVSSQPPRHKRRQKQKARAQQAALQQHQPQQHHSLQATFCPTVLPEGSLAPSNRVALKRPLDPVSDLGGQQGRAGLGHTTAEPMQVEPSLPAADQVTASAAVPAADTVPLASPPEFPDASMPQASPASVPQDFPDGATASAMLLWAEDSDVPLDTARQAVQRVHARHSQQVRQHASASHVSLPEPLQALMVAVVRELNGDASFQPFNSDSAHNSSSAPPQPASSKPQSAPRRSGRASNPVKPYWEVPSAAPGGPQ